MNFIKWITIFFKVKSPVENAIKEARKMNGNKPGWKTTEFWLTILTNLGSVVGALSGVIPADLAVKIIAGINGTYAVARSVLKAIQDVKEARPA